MATAPLPKLIPIGYSDVISSTYDSGNSIGYKPALFYNMESKQVEGYYLQAWNGTIDITLSQFYQGSVFNVNSTHCVCVYYDGALAFRPKYSIFKHDDMVPAFDGKSTPTTANKCNATVHVLANAPNQTSGFNGFFVIPYTKDQFIIIYPYRYWIINISDGSIASTVDIQTGNASYSRFLRFTEFPDAPPQPQVLSDGTLVCAFSQARNASDTADVGVNCIIKIDLTTGNTAASNYSLSNQVLLITPCPSGSFYTWELGNQLSKWVSDLSSRTILGNIGGERRDARVHIANEDNLIYFGVNGTVDVRPILLTVSGSSFTIASKGTLCNSDISLFSYIESSQITESTFLARNAISSGTGTSIGSYVGVYNVSDGDLASGYSKIQMLDAYGAMSISNSGFNDNTFRRTADTRQYYDQSLYIAREITGMIIGDDVPALGTLSNFDAVIETDNSITVDVDYQEATPIDGLDYLTTLVQDNNTPNWANEVNQGTSGGTGTNPIHFQWNLPNTLDGFIYVWVRAYGIDSLGYVEEGPIELYIQPPDPPVPTDPPVGIDLPSKLTFVPKPAIKIPPIVGLDDPERMAKLIDEFMRDVASRIEALEYASQRAGIVPLTMSTAIHNPQAGQLVHIRPDNTAVLAVNTDISKPANGVIQTVLGNGRIIVVGVGKYPVKCKPYRNALDNRLFLSDIPGWAQDTDPQTDVDYDGSERVLIQQVGCKLSGRDNLGLCYTEVRCDEFVIF